jgi:hypothetical protein
MNFDGRRITDCQSRRLWHVLALHPLKIFATPRFFESAIADLVNSIIDTDQARASLLRTGGFRVPGVFLAIHRARRAINRALTAARE